MTTTVPTNTVDIFRTLFLKEKQQVEEIEALKKSLTESQKILHEIETREADLKDEMRGKNNTIANYEANVAIMVGKIDDLKKQLENMTKLQKDHEELLAKYTKLQGLIAKLHAQSTAAPKSTASKKELCKGCKKCNPDNKIVPSNASNCLMCGHLYVLTSMRPMTDIVALCGCTGVGTCCTRPNDTCLNHPDVAMSSKCGKNPSKHECFKCRHK
jgi:hypothetical protein